MKLSLSGPAAPLALWLLLVGGSPPACGQITNIGHALLFDGTTNAAVIASGFQGFPSTNITVEFWARSTDTLRAGSLFSYGAGSTPDTFLIFNHQSLAVSLGAVGSVSTGISLTDGVWHHIAVTWSTTGALRVFEDGVLALSTTDFRTGGVLGNNGTLVLGQDQDSIGGGFSPFEAFSGEMDEVRIWSTIRTATEIAQNMKVALKGNEAGLAAYYRFNEGVGTTTGDATGLGHNGNLRSGVNWSAHAAFARGTALSIASGWAQVPHSPAFNALPMSITAWFRTTAFLPSFGGFLVVRPDPTVTYELMLEVTSGKLAAWYQPALGANTGIYPWLAGADSGLINDGQWHHTAFTVDATGSRLYVDGMLKATAAWTGTPQPLTKPNSLYMGYPAHLFDGQVDEVSVWNVALDPVAIQTNMNRRLTGSEAGLVAVYHFDEGSGILAADASPGLRHGTLTTNSLWSVSEARLHASAQISGRITAAGTGAPNIPVTAVVPSVTAQPLLAIPDAGTVTSTNLISLSGTIGFVKVAVNIAHPFAGDLELTLIHPDGTEVRLRDADATDESADLITSYPEATPAASSLLVLNNKPVAGAWRLRVRDAFPVDSGRLNSWSLQFGGAPALTDANGNYRLTEVLRDSSFLAQSYTVQPLRDGFEFSPPSAVTPAQSSGVNFTLVSGFISGRVSDDTIGLAGVTVSAGPGVSTTTDASGNYRLTAVPPPAVTLTASLPGYAFSPPQHANVPIGASQVDFVTTGYPIAGTIIDAQSKGVAGVTLGAALSSTRTDGEGNYVLAGVPRGRNTIRPTKLGTVFDPTNRPIDVTSAVSNVNFVVIQSPPTITPISDQVVAKNGSSNPLRFDVNDAETRPAFLQVAADSSNPSLVPNANILLQGVGNQRTIQITPATNQTGTARITISVTDNSGRSANTTFQVRVNQPPQPGVGLALNFDGTTNFVSAGTSAIPGKGTFTVEAWVSAPSNAGPRTLLSQSAAFTIGLDPAGQIRVGTNWSTAVNFPFGAWHHVAIVREAANTRLYVDGVLRASRGGAIPFPPQDAPFELGGRRAGEFWLGSVDEVRVWAVARSTSEVASNRTVRVMGNEPNLSGLWRLDERSGVALDSTPNQRHLTVSRATRLPSPLQFETYVTLVGRNITDVLQGYDAEDDSLTFTITSFPARGTLTLLSSNTGAFLYTADAPGQDQFTFIISDGYAVSENHSVSISVLPDVNPPSISFLADQVTAEDTRLGPLSFTVSDAERAGEALLVTGQASDQTLVPDNQIVISPAGGSNRTLSVLPATNRFGTTTITLTVSDGSQQSSISFALTVTPVHDPPIMTMTNMVVGSDQSFSQPIVMWAPDSIPQALRFSVARSRIDGDGALDSVPTVQFCSSSNGSVPCVVMNTLHDNSYQGTERVTVTVDDGIASSQASFQVHLNSTPYIQAIPDQSTFRDIPTKPIYLFILHWHGANEELFLTYKSSNQAVVDDSGFSLEPTYNGLVITPRPGAVGQSAITVTVSDGISSNSASFQLVVKDVLDYDLVELPRLPGAQTTDAAVAAGLNDSGQVVGWSQVGGAPRAVVWDVNGPSPTVTPLLDAPSYALRINNRGQIVGYQNETAFLYTNGVSTTLGARLGYSSAVDINDNGEVVGAYDTPTARAFYYNGSTVTVLSNALFGGSLQKGLALNAQGDVFGAGIDWSAGYPLPTTARVWANRINRTFFSFNHLTGSAFGDSIVGGINNSNWIAVSFFDGPQNRYFPILFNYRTATTNNAFSAALASDLPDFYNAFARGLNDANQVIGYGQTAAGPGGPFLYSDGRAYHLEHLMPGSGITPSDALAINKAGDIVGYGTKPGLSGATAFVLRNLWLVAKPQSPPARAINPVTTKVFTPPVVTALDGTSGTDLLRAYLWSDFEQKLYFLRPIHAAVSWFTTTNVVDTNTPPIVRQWRVAWPRVPQIHVAGAPVHLNPVDAGSPYRPMALSYSTAGAVMDPNSRIFNATNPGYSVIQYLLAPEVSVGGTPDLLTHSNYFEVIRTEEWKDTPGFQDNKPALVGTKVTDPRGPSVITNSFKTGWTTFPRAPYDGAGVDRAYDRTTQTGPIIPVNVVSTATMDDLVVAFYKRHTLTSTLWPDLPVRYSILWPPNVTPLVMANSEGSGPLPEAQYASKRIYVQPNANLPGYNPNEEHALLAPTTSGQGVFALRNDLNRPDTSECYVLLKYRNPTNSEWQFKLFQPVLSDANHGFTFTGQAGQEILPPYPLGLLTICPATTNISTNAFRDHRGKFYASTGPTPFDLNPQVVMRYSYPLQPGFYYDLDRNGADDLPVGECVPWNGIPPKSSTAQPVDVVYRVRWPDDAPALQIGETLMKPKHDLPGIKNWASAHVVFDSLDPNGTTPLTNTARLYDPLSARVLHLTNVVSADYQFPPDIALQTVAGKQIFSDLPFYLRSRLSYDPVNKAISFAGFLDDTVTGEPLLLVNVLSDNERARIKKLSNGPGFPQIIDALYHLTRNPNRVNVAHPGEAPDLALLIGFTTQYSVLVTNGVSPNLNVIQKEFFGDRPTGSNIAVLSSKIVHEPFGDGPKALTAGMPVPSANVSFGHALLLDGIDDFVSTPQLVDAPQTFTISLWFKTTTAKNFSLFVGFGDQSTNATGAADRDLFMNGDGTLNFYVWDVGPHTITSSERYDDGHWHHAAATFSAATGMRLYADGVLVAQNPNVTFGYTYVPGGYWRLGHGFNGTIDDVQIWEVARTTAQIREAMNRPLQGGETGLLRYWRFDETVDSWALDSTPHLADGILQSNPQRVTSDLATASAAERYIVLAENDDPALGSFPVTLHVIKVDGGPFAGDLKILYPDNVFDERLTLRHSPDFGADPDSLEFEWWYHPDEADFDPTRLPTVDADGSISNAEGWLIYTPALSPSKSGQNTITIGDGGETSQFTLADNWFISRYRGYNIGGRTNWSPWVGDPAGKELTRAALAPGWVKRVVEGINPFEARTTNFHETAANTFSSMLIQAGQRYEGDIAFNPSGENRLGLGLIEAYTTVLNRGKNLSIDGLPPVDSDPLNNALLLAASRISDLYMLLGNEAFADAEDPTIGFFSDEISFGTVATSLFAFQNQLDSPLEEELALLRGRDDSAAGVGAPPVYNRLLWNFTGSAGEVAYERTYNVGDVNLDGLINEFDAKILFPQGHGDAWGHYLTALTTYYDLLRHPRFTWIPRSENVLVAGTAVRVDFLDERKFALAAAGKARAGSEIVDLTYRSRYVDDPAGQYQGYKDTRADRAWGVTEWARRAGQGAYFDWLVGNAILPSTDPNTNHTGIQKIDRQTVQDLDQIISEHALVQTELDKSDAGLNPLGLAKNAVPFDIDPSLLAQTEGAQSVSHFEQIYDRAARAMNNCVTVWNQANLLSEALRRQQDEIDDFNANVADQERDFKNRLIEVFGLPYAGDIGAGKLYPSGYNGPDLYHYMYVNTAEISGETTQPSATFRGFFRPLQTDYGKFGFSFPSDSPLPSAQTVNPNDVLTVDYPTVTGDWVFAANATMGQRQAPGELQMAISDLIQEQARLKQALKNYDNLVRQIRDNHELLNAQYDLNTNALGILNEQKNTIIAMNTAIGVMYGVQLALRSVANAVSTLAEAAKEAIPTDLTDFMAPARGLIKGIGIGGAIILNTSADVLDVAENSMSLSKETVPLETEIKIQTATRNFELQQKLKELEQLIRQEAVQRLECHNQAELVKQTFGRYLAAVNAGLRLVNERSVFRQRTAALTQQNRYKDMAFRVFRNEALEKYRAQFALAARFVFLAATAYDYDLNFLGTDNRAGRDFFTDIVRQRSIGQLLDGIPIAGSSGLADGLGRLKQNFEVLRPRFGLNNPQTETARFSLRKELFRIRDDSDAQWRATLKQAIVPNLWEVPEFRRFCRPFAPESAGPQPGLLLRFPTTITFGLNFFGFPLGGGDSAYDPSLFTTKINSVGIWFENYNSAGLAIAPRVYLVPAGMDVQRSPTGNTLATREWKIIDQAIPVPFPIGASSLTDPTWIPMNDTLSESFAQIRHFSSFRAYHDAGDYDQSETTRDTRLIGRSVWNTDWLLIIPGGTFLFDPDQGLDAFISTVSDIKLSLQSYSYSGD